LQLCNYPSTFVRIRNCLSDLLHKQLHWLDVSQRVQFKLRNGPQVSAIQSSTVPNGMLSSAVCQLPPAVHTSHQHSTFGYWAYSVAGPVARSLLPDTVCYTTPSFCSFQHDFKNLTFHIPLEYTVQQRFCDYALHKLTTDTNTAIQLHSKIYLTSGYATWFMAGGAIRIAHYDVIDDVVTRKL